MARAGNFLGMPTIGTEPRVPIESSRWIIDLAVEIKIKFDSMDV